MLTGFKKRHKSSLRGAITCPWKMADGTDCSFALDDDEAAAVQSGNHVSPALLHHAEAEHAFVDCSRDKFFFCKQHGRWLIGAVMIEEHHELHLDAPLEETTELPSWEAGCCPFCVDETLPASERAKVFDLSSSLRTHVLQVHLYPPRDAERLCPLCDDAQHVADFLQHLLDKHGRKYASQRRLRIGRDWSALPKAAGALQKEAREKWIEWVGSLDENGVSSLPDVAVGDPAATATRTRKSRVSQVELVKGNSSR